MKRFMKNNKRGGAIIPESVRNRTASRNLLDLAEDDDCEKYIEDLESGKINEQRLASDLINGKYKSKCDPIFLPEKTNIEVSQVEVVGKRVDDDIEENIIRKLHKDEISNVNGYIKYSDKKFTYGGKRKSRKNKSKKNKSRRHRKKQRN